MKHSIQIQTLIAGLAGLVILTACNPGTLPANTIGVPAGAGTQKASLSGAVVKADKSPARNATLVLIQKTGGVDRDVQVIQTDDNGLYRMTDVPAGEYRLAFVLQTQDERKNQSAKPIYYDPSNELTSRYFSFITTGNFNYNGAAGTTYQVPQLNVGWISNLSPHATTVDGKAPIPFSWSPVEGATGYSIDIRDSNNNPFYKAFNLTSTNFSWSDLKGNQGSNNGKAVSPGTYYYLITANLKRDAGIDGPTPNYGGTALATFTVR